MTVGKPSILFLLTDQQRADSLGCYGSEVAKTPHIDTLTRGGVVFDNCYVQNPLYCSARYRILTGRYPHSHRIRANWYAPRQGEVSFGEQLGRVGYTTSMIGKSHLKPWYDTFGFDGRIISEAKFNTTCPDDYQRFLSHLSRLVQVKTIRFFRSGIRAECYGGEIKTACRTPHRLLCRQERV